MSKQILDREQILRHINRIEANENYKNKKAKDYQALRNSVKTLWNQLTKLDRRNYDPERNSN